MSQGFISPALSKTGDRNNSLCGRQLQLTSIPSHSAQSKHREEEAALRTVAEVHCILAEVRQSRISGGNVFSLFPC